MSDVVWTAVNGTVTFALGAGALWCVERAKDYARKSKREYDTDLIRELTRRWWSLVHSPETGKWWVTKVNPDNPDKPEFIASHARWQVRSPSWTRSRRPGIKKRGGPDGRNI